MQPNMKIKINSDKSFGDTIPLEKWISRIAFYDTLAFARCSYNSEWLNVFSVTQGDTFTPIDSYYVIPKEIEVVNGKLYIKNGNSIFRINIDDLHNPIIEGYCPYHGCTVGESFIFTHSYDKISMYQYTPQSGVSELNHSNSSYHNSHILCSSSTINLLSHIIGDFSSFSIYNINGSKVMHGFIDKNSPEIDISGLNNGIYFCRISNVNSIRTVKLTLLK